MRAGGRLCGWAVRGVVTGGLLYAVFAVVPVAQVMRALASADGAALASAFALLLTARALAAWRTKGLADQQGLSVSVWQAFEINAASMFYGLWLPGSLSGGAVRWYKLSRKDGRPSDALTVIVFDRLADTVGLAGIGLVCWLLGTRTAHHPLVGASLLAVLGALGAVYLLAFEPRASGAMLGGLRRRGWSWVPARLRATLKGLAVSAERYHGVSWRFLASTVGLSVASHVAGAASFWLLVRALDLRIGLLDAGWVRSATMLLTMLPIAVAGFGVREGGYVLLLGPLGVSAADAVAVSLTRFLIGLVAALLGGALELKNLWLAKPGRSAGADPAAAVPARPWRERIAVVVLNYNKREALLACLESVRRLAFAPCDVVVVDNGSTDGSAEAVAEAFPDARLVRHPENLGAVRGRNAGWREASRRGALDGVFFLDNDTVVTRDCLTSLVEAMRRDPRAGIFCGKAYTRFPSRTIMSAGIDVNWYTGAVRDRGAGLMDDGRYDQPGYVDACGGFAYLVRPEVWGALGGLDERFGLYGWEDVDFCLRAKARGALCRYVPDALVFHSGGTIGRRPVFAYERLKVRNYLLLLQRHTTRLQRLSCLVCVPVRALGLMARLASQGHAAMFAAHWQGLREGLRALAPARGRRSGAAKGGWS